MKYNELKIYTTTLGAEMLTAILGEHDISGFSVEDPNDVLDLLNKKNSYDWDYFDPELMINISDEVVVTFYLEETLENSKRIEDIFRRLEAIKADTERLYSAFSYGSLRTERRLRSDEEWKDVWKTFFKPLLIAEGLWIKPSWEDFAPQNPGDKVLELDPGMAFGTGKHETTALCVRLMKESFKPGTKVLDVGCGSGILSIAAALFGAAEVLAVDVDKDAVLVAEENVRRNGCGEIVKVVCGDLTKDIDFLCDMVLANLTAELIIELIRYVKKNLRSDAVFITSGILTEKQSSVREVLVANGFRIIKERTDGEWCAFLASTVLNVYR